MVGCRRDTKKGDEAGEHKLDTAGCERKGLIGRPGRKDRIVSKNESERPKQANSRTVRQEAAAARNS
jgi:hypothetical protein